jgi:hypothetical protein
MFRRWVRSITHFTQTQAKTCTWEWGLYNMKKKAIGLTRETVLVST